MSPRPGRTPAERAAAGRQARARAPRSGHGEWEPAADRPSPLQTLASQDATRVPGLVPVRYGRMLASPFAFFRGGAAIMAADLAPAPRTELEVQLCGDAHLSNFGVFSAPDRQLVFDINDFDETHPGPFEWDLKRLAASFAIAGRELGFSRKQRRAAIAAAAAEYRRATAGFARMREIEIWYARLSVAAIRKRYRSQATAKQVRRFEKNLAKARNKDSLRALAKLTVRDGDSLRMASRPPLLVPIEEAAAAAGTGASAGRIEDAVRQVLSSYRRTLAPQCRHLINGYRYVDAAHKVVGVGSVGTRAWVALLLGRDDDDPLFLQFKEAQASVLEPYAAKGRYSHHGRRVVEGQRLTQASSDLLLGWLTTEGLDGNGRDFYVRQLWDGKGSAEVELMGPRTMAGYANLCGWTLARAHARTGDPIAISGYLGRGERFDRAMSEFAEAYADQNERDYAEVSEAARAGKIEVSEGL
jgi:uncharacterized protein (DUF2252 family)